MTHSKTDLFCSNVLKPEGPSQDLHFHSCRLNTQPLLASEVTQGPMVSASAGRPAPWESIYSQAVSCWGAWHSESTVLFTRARPHRRPQSLKPAEDDKAFCPLEQGLESCQVFLWCNCGHWQCASQKMSPIAFTTPWCSHIRSLKAASPTGPAPTKIS